MNSLVSIRFWLNSDSNSSAVSISKPRGPDAPAPIRVASAERAGDDDGIPGMVSPITGKAMAAEPDRSGKMKPTTTANLSDRLSRVDQAGTRSE